MNLGLEIEKIGNEMRVEKLESEKSILKLQQNIRMSMNNIHAGFFYNFIS